MPFNPLQPVSQTQFQGWASFYGGNVTAPSPPPPSAFGSAALGQPPSNGQYQGGWAYPDSWANFYEGQQGFTAPQNQNSPAGALAAENYSNNVNNPNDPNLLGWEQAYGNPQTILSQDQNWAQSLGNAPLTGPITGGWENPEAWAAYYGGSNGFTAPANAGSPASALAAAATISQTSSPQDNPALLGWVADYGQPGNILANTPNWAASLGTPDVNSMGQDVGQTNTQGWESPLAWAAYYGGLQGYSQPVDNNLQAAQNWAGVTNANDPSLLGWELDYGNPQTVVSVIEASQPYQSFVAQQNFAANPQLSFNATDALAAQQNLSSAYGTAWENFYGDPSEVLNIETEEASLVGQTAASPNDWQALAPIAQADLNAGTNVPFTTAFESIFGPPSVWFSEGSPAASLPFTPSQVWQYVGNSAAAEANAQNAAANQYNAGGGAPVANYVSFENGQPTLDDLIQFANGQFVFAPPGSTVSQTVTSNGSSPSVSSYGVLNVAGIGVGPSGQLTNIANVNVPNQEITNTAPDFLQAQLSGQRVIQTADGPVLVNPDTLTTGQLPYGLTPIEETLSPLTPTASIPLQQASVQGAGQQAVQAELNFLRSLGIHGSENAAIAAGTPEYFNAGDVSGSESAPGVGSPSNTGIYGYPGSDSPDVDANVGPNALGNSGLNYGLYGENAYLYGLEANALASQQAGAAEQANAVNASSLGGGSTLFNDLGGVQTPTAAAQQQQLMSFLTGLNTVISQAEEGMVPELAPFNDTDYAFIGPPQQTQVVTDAMGNPLVTPPQPFDFNNLTPPTSWADSVRDYINNLGAGWTPPASSDITQDLSSFPDISIQPGGQTAQGVAVTPYTQSQQQQQPASSAPEISSNASNALLSGLGELGINTDQIPAGEQANTQPAQSIPQPGLGQQEQTSNLALQSGLQGNVTPSGFADNNAINSAAVQEAAGSIPYLDSFAQGQTDFNPAPPIDWSIGGLEGQGLGINTVAPQNANERFFQQVNGNWTVANLAKAAGYDPATLQSYGVDPNTVIDPTQPIQPQIDALLANTNFLVRQAAGPAITAGLAAQGLSVQGMEAAAANPNLIYGQIGISGQPQNYNPGFQMPSDMPMGSDNYPAPIPPADIPDTGNVDWNNLPSLGGLTYAPTDPMLAGTGNAPQAFIMHHTGPGISTVGQLQNVLSQRGLGVEYAMDPDGNIVQIGGPGAQNVGSENNPGFNTNFQNPIMGPDAGFLNNNNIVGMEVMAGNNAAVTQAQIDAAQQFIQSVYPNTPVFGHGEINVGHKEADEGMAIVNAINQARFGNLPNVNDLPSNFAAAAPALEAASSPEPFYAQFYGGGQTEQPPVFTQGYYGGGQAEQPITVPEGFFGGGQQQEQFTTPQGFFGGGQQEQQIQLPQGYFGGGASPEDYQGVGLSPQLSDLSQFGVAPPEFSLPGNYDPNFATGDQPGYQYPQGTFSDYAPYFTAPQYGSGAAESPAIAGLGEPLGGGGGPIESGKVQGPEPQYDQLPQEQPAYPSGAPSGMESPGYSYPGGTFGEVPYPDLLPQAVSGAASIEPTFAQSGDSFQAPASAWDYTAPQPTFASATPPDISYGGYSGVPYAQQQETTQFGFPTTDKQPTPQLQPNLGSLSSDQTPYLTPDSYSGGVYAPPSDVAAANAGPDWNAGLSGLAPNGYNPISEAWPGSGQPLSDVAQFWANERSPLGFLTNPDGIMENLAAQRLMSVLQEEAPFSNYGQNATLGTLDSIINRYTAAVFASGTEPSAGDFYNFLTNHYGWPAGGTQQPGGWGTTGAWNYYPGAATAGDPGVGGLNTDTGMGTAYDRPVSDADAAIYNNLISQAINYGVQYALPAGGGVYQNAAGQFVTGNGRTVGSINYPAGLVTGDVLGVIQPGQPGTYNIAPGFPGAGSSPGERLVSEQTAWLTQWQNAMQNALRHAGGAPR